MASLCTEYENRVWPKPKSSSQHIWKFVWCKAKQLLHRLWIDVCLLLLDMENLLMHLMLVLRVSANAVLSG